MADLLVPAKAIASALRRLEAAPAMATGSFVVVFAWLMPILIAQAVRGSSWPLASSAVIAAMLVGMITYVVGVRRFRDSCGARKGWVAALFRHHVYGLLAGVFVTAVVAGCLSLLVGTVLSVNSPVSAIPGRFVFIGVVVIVVGGGGAWIFARLAKHAIVPLQRARAAEMAREYEAR